MSTAQDALFTGFVSLDEVEALVSAAIPVGIVKAGIEVLAAVTMRFVMADEWPRLAAQNELFEVTPCPKLCSRLAARLDRMTGGATHWAAAVDCISALCASRAAVAAVLRLMARDLPPPQGTTTGSADRETSSPRSLKPTTSSSHATGMSPDLDAAIDDGESWSNSDEKLAICGCKEETLQSILRPTAIPFDPSLEDLDFEVFRTASLGPASLGMWGPMEHGLLRRVSAAFLLVASQSRVLQSLTTGLTEWVIRESL
eukprot:Polyplicarium_translucidae@DN1948_c0_g1_i4.p1